MNLTFKGFLKAYLRELSGQESLALSKLVKFAEGNCSRLVEPLIIFAALSDQLEYLHRLTAKPKLKGVIEEFSDNLKAYSSVEEYLKMDAASPRMQNVWNAFLAKKHQVEPSRRIVGLMRPKILSATQEQSVTIYRMCKDLGLNLGNVYAYLNGGDATKVTKKTADRMLEYLEAMA